MTSFQGGFIQICAIFGEIISYKVFLEIIHIPNLRILQAVLKTLTMFCKSCSNYSENCKNVLCFIDAKSVNLQMIAQLH